MTGLAGSAPDGTVAASVRAVAGRVSVTVVGVAAQCVQTVTVVVQPSGTEGDVVEVADTVQGQYVLV